MAKDSKKKHIWSSIKLRLTLFRIWFMKNILVFLQILGITCIILMLTGVITQETPILGPPLYLLFGPLIDEIVEIIMSKNISGLMDFFGIFISLLVSVGMFTMKVKNIAQSDIKSDKLKIALIQANLYFNEDGKLVKKVEKMTKTDIDGDGKVEGEPTVNQGLFSGIASAAKEFVIIATADLSGTEEENKQTYDNTIKEVGYEGLEEATNEVSNTLKIGVTNAIADESIEEINKRIETTKEDTNMSTVEKTKKISLFAKLKEFFMKHKKSMKKKEDFEVVENHVEEDAKVAEVKKEVTAQDIIAKKNTAPVEHVTSTSDFLKKMRGGL